MSANFPRTRLACDQLEARENPAGNVVASLSGGTLRVAGDAADNQISIQQNAAGDIIIYGYDGTAVNGLPSVYVGRGVLDRLEVDMADGADYADTSGVLVNIDLTLYGGNGHDTLAVYNSSAGNSIAVGGGPDNDYIAITNAVAGNSVFMAGGSGIDTLDYNGASAGWGQFHWEFETFV
jgi:hypothetical protein